MTDKKPGWLAARIAATTRQAHPGLCPHCGKAVLTGPDADQAALTVVIDAEPDHRPHHTVWAVGSRIEIHREAKPIHYEHECEGKA